MGVINGMTGYKVFIISTIVDILRLFAILMSGYKVFIISTIVDYDNISFSLPAAIKSL